MKTELAYIAGDLDQVFVNPYGKTAGQLDAMFAARQYAILAQATGEAKYKRYRDQLARAFTSGLGYLPGDRGPQQIVNVLRRRSGPATFARGGVGQWQPAWLDQQAARLDCLFPNVVDAAADYWRQVVGQDPADGVINSLLASMDNPTPTNSSWCGGEMKRRIDNLALMNSRLKDASPHQLYVFQRKASGPARVQTKQVLHEIATLELSKISNINLVSFRNWLATNCMELINDKAGEAYGPEGYIEALQLKAQQESGANVGGILAVIGAVIGLVVSAASAAIQLKRQLDLSAQQKKAFEAATQGYGSLAWGPEWQDWTTAGTDGGPTERPGGSGDLAGLDLQNLVLPGVLAAAAFLIE